jgi:hypothetical protein
MTIQTQEIDRLNFSTKRMGEELHQAENMLRSKDKEL